MSESFCGDVPVTITEASLLTAQWAALATSLDINPTEARIYHDSGKVGYSGFVAVDPHSNHCKLVECFRYALKKRSCDECDDIESFHCLHSQINIAALVQKTVQNFLSQPQSQSAIEQVAHALTQHKTIGRPHLLSLTADLLPTDLDRFFSQIMDEDRRLEASRG